MRFFAFCVYGIALILFCGCAPLGSKARIYNPNRLKEINRIAVVPVKETFFKEPPFDESLNAAFLESLKSKLPAIIPAEKEYIPRYRQQGSVFAPAPDITDLLASEKYDAVLVCFWKPMFGGDSKVRLFLYDAKTSILIAKSRHNTKLGTSYWVTPDIFGTLKDATNGAIKAFGRKVNRLKASPGNKP